MSAVADCPGCAQPDLFPHTFACDARRDPGAPFKLLLAAAREVVRLADPVFFRHQPAVTSKDQRDADEWAVIYDRLHTLRSVVDDIDEMPASMVPRIVELATNLCVAWERGRLEANRALWERLREALESAGLLGIYGEPMPTLRPTLKVLVEEWQAAAEVCKAAFDKFVGAARRELAAVGGYATTRANENGVARDYQLHEGLPCGGVTRDPERHPEVGELLLQLERDHREAAGSMFEAIAAVREYVSARGGGQEPEHVALALLRDEGAVR